MTQSQDIEKLLDTITALSHEFGTGDYVCGGGGNTSAKTGDTLWVKPSGTTLKGLRPDLFVALDRGKLGQLYRLTPPADPSSREAVVKDVMADAALAPGSGRASVEAPLHDSLAARFVVHTHPALVNGLTCAKNGKAACADLFPDALWLDYIDPGYTLCMQVRSEIKRYQDATGRQPEVIFLKNHGVFVAGDTPRQIRQSYNAILTALAASYQKAGLAAQLSIGPEPDAARQAAVRQQIRQAYNDPTLAVIGGGASTLPDGPVTPDHIVYAKSYYLRTEPTAAAATAFEQRHGYQPHIIVFNDAVWGVGTSENKAALALELARDAGLVMGLADAFGGIDYMTDRAREFIENWEVESYRSKQTQ
jgi:rhamnose utilization protein RhaD (predicted bifunctional aldolase and dehydrogenase)